MKKKFKILSSDEMDVLKARFDTFTFNRDTDLVYENQIPNTGVVLVDGELNLFKRSKILEKINSSVALGVYQLVNDEPVKIGIKVKSPSEVILLNKSEIREILNQEENCEVQTILQKLI